MTTKAKPKRQPQVMWGLKQPDGTFWIVTPARSNARNYKRKGEKVVKVEVREV